MSNLTYRKNINDKYNVHDITKCKKLIEDIYKSDTINNINKLAEGSFGYVYLKYENTCGSLVIKKFKKIQRDSSIIKTECKILNMVKKAVDDFICPNFIYAYYAIYNKIEPLVIMEYIDITLGQFAKNEYSLHIFDVIIFQILMGVLCMEKSLKINHNDLGKDNIFIKFINKDTVLKYNINGIEYYVKTYGYLVVIGDFGISTLKKSQIKNNTLEYRFATSLNMSFLKCKLRTNKIDTVDKLMYYIIDKKIVPTIQKKYEEYIEKANKRYDDIHLRYKEKTSEYVDSMIFNRMIKYLFFDNNYIDVKDVLSDLEYSNYLYIDNISNILKKTTDVMDIMYLFDKYKVKLDFDAEFNLSFQV
jgi:serine/threonine protein kinase